MLKGNASLKMTVNHAMFVSFLTIRPQSQEISNRGTSFPIEIATPKIKRIWISPTLAQSINCPMDQCSPALIQPDSSGISPILVFKEEEERKALQILGLELKNQDAAARRRKVIRIKISIGLIFVP